MITFIRFLGGAATAVALSIAVSSSALAHGAGMGSGHIGGEFGHVTSTNVIGNGTNRFTRLGDHDARRFRFRHFGYVYPSTVCFHKWTELGRVRVCPDYDY
jgi:hypothetical protein